MSHSGFLEFGILACPCKAPLPQTVQFPFGFGFPVRGWIDSLVLIVWRGGWKPKEMGRAKQGCTNSLLSLFPCHLPSPGTGIRRIKQGARQACRYLRSSMWANSWWSRAGNAGWMRVFLPPWGHWAVTGRPSNPALPSSLLRLLMENVN